MSAPVTLYKLLINTLRGLGLFFLVVFLVFFLAPFSFKWIERNSWRSDALSRLAKTEGDDPMVQSELHNMKVPTSKSEPGSWSGRSVIRMTNGEYLIYQYWHRSAMVEDLLLARGSNGLWYSGHDHYCNDMAMIRFDPPASSIAEFASKYCLSEFDGPEQSKAE
ncbi:MAG: hypothetical protein V4662_01115 [Verrucomicrobiota bacterium]